MQPSIVAHQILLVIATDLGIPGQIDSKGELIGGSAAKSAWKNVQSWMTKDGNIGWCLIIDGINDEADVNRLGEIVPVCGHGHIIITSRMRVAQRDHLIDVPVMDKEAGLKLLLGNKQEGLTEKGTPKLSCLN
jgi:hypothetical protein